jgi:molybdenum cofactor biosynthesis enzyme MoaA
MSTRIFSSAGQKDGETIIYDPCSGLVFSTGDRVGIGRIRLKADYVKALPAVMPQGLQRDFPLSLCWSPIVHCNLECPYCLDDKNLQSGDASNRARIATLIASTPILGVDISGGEPLLLSDLPQLAETFTKAGIALSVTTNGWLLSRVAPILAKSIDAVRVSLDAPYADLHDKWRGQDSFRRAIEGVRAALAVGIPVQLHTVVMRSNLELLQGVVNLALELGAHGVTFLQMLPIGEAVSFGNSEIVSDTTAEEVIASLSLPDELVVRIRKRSDAGGFTVVRADGTIWRNNEVATSIISKGPLAHSEDLRLERQDGSA